MNKMNLNTWKRVVGLICIAGVFTSALTGCGDAPTRAIVNDAGKKVPDIQHIQTKPGESKVMAFKRAFRQSAPTN